MQSGWTTISGNSSANAFSRDHSCDVADLFVIEDDDVDVVFHAVVHGLCIHVEDFRARVLARLILLPRNDPQFRRNQERVSKDAERERISIEWELGYPVSSEATSTPVVNVAPDAAVTPSE